MTHQKSQYAAEGLKYWRLDSDRYRCEMTKQGGGTLKIGASLSSSQVNLQKQIHYLWRLN